jgi:Flp pilus assembly protein TadD
MLRLGIKKQAAIALLIFASAIIISTRAAAADSEACNVPADFALGEEDYPTAITLHRNFLISHPDDALAHYHLGFAYGMLGRRADEISEYLAAQRLHLKKWDLFLNLGLAYLEQQQLVNAAGALETAASIGPEHAETHFNLAIVYERQKRLDEALREITVSRRLAPDDPDAANTNAIICAEMGNLACARDIWTHLVQTAPSYAAARANLAMLGKSCTGNCSPYVRSEETDGLALSQVGAKSNASSVSGVEW